MAAPRRQRGSGSAAAAATAAWRQRGIGGGGSAVAAAAAWRLRGGSAAAEAQRQRGGGGGGGQLGGGGGSLAAARRWQKIQRFTRSKTAQYRQRRRRRSRSKGIASRRGNGGGFCHLGRGRKQGASEGQHSKDLVHSSLKRGMLWHRFDFPYSIRLLITHLFWYCHLRRLLNVFSPTLASRGLLEEPTITRGIRTT